MPQILPFKAVRYDPQIKLGDVVTQPYDKINEAMQTRYYELNPHNLGRIILGKSQPNDHPGFDVYSRAAEYFHDWQSSGILKQDAEPALYLYSQSFTIPGTRDVAERKGIIALGRLHDYSERVVYPHER